MDHQNFSSSEFNIKAKDRPNPVRKRVIIYILTGAVIAVYLFALFLGSKTKVTREYRMYYIDRSLSDWPGLGHFTYKPGTLEYCINYNKYKENSYTLCLRKGKGWDGTFPDGSINTGNEANIYYPIEGGLSKGSAISMDISEFYGTGPVKVYFKYTPLGNYSKIADQNNYKDFDESIQEKIEIGEFSDNGKYSFSLPEVADGDLTQVIFESGGSTFKLWTIEIGDRNE